MKSDIELLTQIFGTTEGLHWLPLMRSLGFSGVQAVGAWQTAYQTRGLGFGVDRATAEALRRLTAAGLLATSGSTQGKSHRLTMAGVTAAQAAMGLDTRKAADLLTGIIGAEAESGIMLPGTDDKPLAMAWQLVDGAGEWLAEAQSSDRAWQKYQANLAALSDALCPLLVLGLAMLYTDEGGRLWGVRATDAGRAVEWPDVPTVDCDSEACWRAFEAGFDDGLAYERRPVPADFHAMVTRMIPASKW